MQLFKHKCLVCGCTWDAPNSPVNYPENAWTPCDHFYSSVVLDDTFEVPDEEEDEEDWR